MTKSNRQKKLNEDVIENKIKLIKIKQIKK